MKKNVVVILGVLILAGLAWGAVWTWKNLRGAGPAFRPPSGNIADQLPNSTDQTATSTNPSQSVAQNSTGFPLKLPDGFSISVFQKDLPGARVLAFDGKGNMWVSQTSKGVISLVEIKNGKPISVSAVFKNLKNPHGLAIDPDNGTTLYFAEENKISKVTLYAEDSPHKIADLPSGSGHYTRTLGFGPDGRLYVSIGSSCNVCNEQDERRASVYSLNKDGSDMKPFATGLRNTVFFVWSYVDGQLWGTDNGRDYLGDNLPPDEINKLEEGKNYGWPICYGQNIHDTNFDKNVYIQNPCNGKTPPEVELPAHSAPLGLTFVPEEGWPKQYANSLIVAFHGSWNRSQPTGYKLALVKLYDKGESAGVQDFVTGWLSSDGKTALGRPVGVYAQPGGVLYVTDDKAGLVYKVTYNGQK